MKPVFETPRLVLKEMSLADLDVIAEMLAYPEAMRFWPKCTKKGRNRSVQGRAECFSLGEYGCKCSARIRPAHRAECL